MSGKRQFSLLTFFKKQPLAVSENVDDDEGRGVKNGGDDSLPSKAEQASERSKRNRNEEDEDGGKKRRRVVIDSDSEDDGNDKSRAAGNVSMVDDLEEDLEDLTALKKQFGIKNKHKAESSPCTSTPYAHSKKSSGGMSELTKSFLNSFQADDSISYSSFNMEDSISSGTVTSDKSQYEHTTLDFLKPEYIRDINKNKPSDPEYDCRTLFVPESYYKKVTPGMYQWWQIKSQHFDTILFFKVGKFYEMYHMDAATCVRELNLTYMRGKFAHCGFPEIAYGRFADQLVQRGYKVARVEQTETPQQLEERKESFIFED